MLKYFLKNRDQFKSS